MLLSDACGDRWMRGIRFPSLICSVWAARKQTIFKLHFTHLRNKLCTISAGVQTCVSLRMPASAWMQCGGGCVCVCVCALVIKKETTTLCHPQPHLSPNNTYMPVQRLTSAPRYVCFVLHVIYVLLLVLNCITFSSHLKWQTSQLLLLLLSEMGHKGICLSFQIWDNWSNTWDMGLGDADAATFWQIKSQWQFALIHSLDAFCVDFNSGVSWELFLVYWAISKICLFPCGPLLFVSLIALHLFWEYVMDSKYLSTKDTHLPYNNINKIITSTYRSARQHPWTSTITSVFVCKKDCPKGQIYYTVQTPLTDEHTVKLEKVITRPKKSLTA